MITRGPSFSLEIWLWLDSKSISPNPSGGGGNDGKLAHYFLLNYVEQVGLFRQFQVSLHTCRRERTRSIDALVYSALTSYRSFLSVCRPACTSIENFPLTSKFNKSQPITSIKIRKNWKNSVSNSSRLFLYFRIRAGRFFCVPTGRLWMCPCVICQKRRWPLISQSTSALLVVYFFSRAGPAFFFLKMGIKGRKKRTVKEAFNCEGGCHPGRGPFPMAGRSRTRLGAALIWKEERKEEDGTGLTFILSRGHRRLCWTGGDGQ